MTCGIFGEISASGDAIIILAAGDDHELDQAAAALRRLTPLLARTSPPGALQAPLTWPCVTQLAHTFDGGMLGQWTPGPQLSAWIYDEFMKRTAASSETATAPQPAADARQSATVLVPRPYQLEAAAMIGAIGKFLLFDEPGCGKTASTILGLIERQKRGHDIFPMVIVVPSWDVADVWARHVRDWAPHWPEPLMHGGKDRSRHRLPREDAIFITTYATATRDAADAKGFLARLNARATVLDEHHLCKRISTKRTQASQRIARHSGTVVALSGTPITRNTGDIYSVLEIMDPESWPAKERFVKRYCTTTDDGYGESIQGLEPLREPEFRAALLGQHRRVAKKDVLDQLPDKVYSVRRVEIPPEWRRAYDDMASDMLAEMPDTGEELEVMSVLAQLTRLSQLASSACDVEVELVPDELTGELRKKYTVTLKAPSWKVDALLEVLAERRGVQQVAVFGASRPLVEIAGAACEAAGYRCGYITGARNAKERKADIDAFQAGALDIMLATMGAGSLGITLTSAGTAVFLQRSWQLDQSVQSEDRLHRIGQQHDCVEVIDIIARDTIDDRVRELLRVKSGQLAQLVRDPRVVKELLGGIK